MTESISEILSRDYPRCKEPGCCNVPGANGFCCKHGKPVKKVTKIKPVSDKRKVLNRDLAKLVAQIKKDNPECQMKVPGVCSKVTTTVHHSKGRIGDLLLNPKYLIASCSECNLWEVNNPKEAKAMGISVDRLIKETI